MKDFPKTTPPARRPHLPTAALLLFLLLALAPAPEASAQLFRSRRQMKKDKDRLEQLRDTLGPSASRDRREGITPEFPSSPDTVLFTGDPVVSGEDDDNPDNPTALAPSSSYDPLRSKRALTRENEKLMQIIDSLQGVINEYEARMQVSDSLAGDIIELFQENENKVAAVSTSQEGDGEDDTDSRLRDWYNSSAAVRSGQPMAERFSPTVSDEMYIRRLEDLESYITLPYNETVRNYIILYSEKMPEKMARMLALSQYYFPIFEQILSDAGMPEELKMMAVIESALNPTAVSKAGAKGMWQFMHSTAKNYGLYIDSFVDERLDPVKAAGAAAQYLADSYRIFGDWNLAISSYNCGPGNVNKAIRRAGGKSDFWSIYEYLPSETRGYMPAFVGAMYAFRYYKEHGLRPDTETSIPTHVDTFHIGKMLHFQQVNALTGAPVETLRELNPQYIHDIIPGGSRTFILRLPYQYTAAFIDAGDSLYAYKASELFAPAVIKQITSSSASQSRTRRNTSASRTVYTVKRGDNLSKIADRYSVSVKEIRQWNKLKDNTVWVGQKLSIYPRGTKTEQASGSRAKTSAGSTNTASYTVYTVKKGDTLFSIARKHSVTMEEIVKVNSLSDTGVRYGQKLKILKK